jgi:hypothetical protein
MRPKALPAMGQALYLIGPSREKATTEEATETSDQDTFNMTNMKEA